MANTCTLLVICAALLGTTLATVTCGDGSYCDGSQTCCPLYAGGYGCCIYSSGVCCSDMTTCCLPGWQCTGYHSCQRTSKIFPDAVLPGFALTKAQKKN